MRQRRPLSPRWDLHGRRPVALAVLVLLWTGAMFVPPVRTTAQERTVTTERKWRPTTVAPGNTADSMTAASHLFAEPTTRVLYAYTSPGSITAYDLDSLAPRGPALAVNGIKTVGYPDPITGSVYLGFSNRALGTSRLDQFGMRNGGVALLGSLDTTTLLTPNQEIIGLYRAPHKPILWLFSARPLASLSQAVYDVTITELELPANDLGRAVKRWSKQLPSCQVAMHGNEAIPVGFGYVPSQGALYFGCGNGAAFERNAPVSRGAARLPLGPGPTPNSSTPGEIEIFPTPGTLSLTDSFFDPVSGRLLFAASNAGSGASIIVFDSVTHTYIGTLAVGNVRLVAAILEPVSGRFYGLGSSPVGMLVTDVRATPVRQGLNFAEFGTFENKILVNHFPAVDPLTGRLFVKYENLDFRVARDAIPWYVPAADEDPDRNTVDVAEDPGKTSATFSAAAQGFGSRHRQVGGIEAVAINLGSGTLPYPVGASTRELRTSYLNSLMIANTESGSNVVTADRDRENTAADMARSPSGDPWPYSPAQCVDFGGESREVTSTTSTVTCDSNVVRATAQTTFDRGEAGGVTVSYSSFKAAAFRHNTRGAVSTATATARGITVLGDALEVGEVVATAEAVAKGRPGTAKATWEPTIRNVKVAGQTLCTDQCDLEAVAREVNSRLGGRLRVDFPQPDPVARKGSPRGFQASIRRIPSEQFQEQALNGQPPDRIEVPAMVVTVFQDDAKAGRTVNEFAAVEVEARYGISLLGGGDVGGGGDGIGTLGQGGGFGEVASASGDSPAFGLSPDAIVPTGVFAPGSGREPADLDLASAGGIVWNGLRGVLRLLPIWAVLLLPVYLSARRWLLLQRDVLITGGSS